MASIATIKIVADMRPAMVDGEPCLVHMTIKGCHGGFVVERGDGSIGEAVQGVNEIKFIDSPTRFNEFCWEADA